jgi:hypothetical protein
MVHVVPCIPLQGFIVSSAPPPPPTQALQTGKRLVTGPTLQPLSANCMKSGSFGFPPPVSKDRRREGSSIRFHSSAQTHPQENPGRARGSPS